MDVKGGSRSSVGEARAQIGVVLEIDENNAALVRMRAGNHERVRADMLRGKSAPPLPGETWIFDQSYGAGWQFAVPVNWTPDRDWIPASMQNAWTSTGAPYLPVGYRRNAEGEVLLCGRMAGGTGGSVALTLPPGYRPAGTVSFLVPVGSNQVTVTANGQVTPGSSGATFLDAVRFMAAS